MNAQSQKTVANCAELKIHIYECRKEPYLAAAYALVLNLGYGFFCGSLLFLINLSGSRVLGSPCSRDTRITIFEPEKNGSRFAGSSICKKTK